MFDVNNNGYIHIDELVHVLKELGEGLDASILEELKTDAEPDAEHQVNIKARAQRKARRPLSPYSA